jgi:hypothetical protein
MRALQTLEHSWNPQLQEIEYLESTADKFHNRAQEEESLPQVFLPWNRPRPVCETLSMDMNIVKGDNY